MSDAPPLGDPSEPPPREPFWSYTDVLLFCALALPSMLLGFGVAKGLVYLLRLEAGVRALEAVAGMFTFYLLLFGALFFMLRIQYRRPFWRSLGWVPAGLPYSALAGMGLASAILVIAIAYYVGVPDKSNPMLELLKDRASILVVAIFGTTLAPLFEELAFRGFLQPLLVRSMGPIPGILAASLPFGLLHFQEYGNSWRHVLLISCAGAMFGWVRHRTGSTRASTVMHAAYNALFFVLFLASGQVRTGAD
jgi:uncharacterized protein